MTAYEQRSYPGAAADTLLNADLTNVGTSFSVTPGTGTGYPDGSGGPFFVILDWDNSKAEKVRCSGRVNDTFTVAGTGGGRGQDGTSAQAHTANAKVRAVITATDIQEANRAAANTIGKVTTKGDLLAGTGANALARVAAGADGTLLQTDSTQAAGVKWSNTGVALDATSTIGGVSGTALAADRTALTAYTPTLTNITIGNGTITGYYKQIGKHTYFSARLALGSTTVIGTHPGIGLPATTSAREFTFVGTAYDSSADNLCSIGGNVVGSGTNVLLAAATGNVSATNPFTFAVADVVTVSGWYEAA